MFGENDKVAELEKQIRALNEQAYEKIFDEGWRRELAQQLGTEMYQGFRNTNMAELVTTVKRYARNETASISSVRGLQAFHIARGGYIEESTIVEDTFYIDKLQIGIHMVEHIDRFETGFVKSADTIINLGAQRLDAEINRAVFRALQIAVPNTADNYSAVNGLGLAALSDAIAQVEDAPDAVYGSGEPVIVARATMIRQIRDALTNNFGFSAFTPETNEDLLRRGQVGSFMGTPIVRIANYRDEMNRPYFPANEVWIVGKDAATTGFFGTPRQHNYITPGEEYWHFINRVDYGVAVTNPTHLHRIVDSSIPAGR